MAERFGALELVTRPGVVMTPRPASLALVERALAHVGDAPAVVADVGTGSGAIAVAIAQAAPRAVVWATDVSRAAVVLARRNSLRCGVASRVRVRRGDLLDPVSGRIDVVVANLPYLPWRERGLHSDLVGEPVHAVFGPGDGLDFYRRLLWAAASRLDTGGLVAVQIRGHVLAAPARRIDDLYAALLQRAA